MNIGAHISSAGDFARAAVNAGKLDLQCVQFFSRNPRGGNQRSVNEDEISRWLTASAEAGLDPVILHSPYTVNLASNRSRVVEFSRQMIVEDLKLCRRLGADCYVLHPGSATGGDPQQGLQQVIVGLNDVLMKAADHLDSGVTVVLELMSGAGNELGSTLHEMKILLEGISRPDAVGFCMDTCHCWVRGYDLVTQKGLDTFVSAFDRVLDLQRLRVIHLNDSQHPIASRKDRHARLGEGQLGPEGIAGVINHPRLRELPFIMEVPVDDEAEYEKQARLARSWRQQQR